MTLDEAALCREYEAGAGMLRLANAHGISRDRVRAVLVANGVEIKKPNGGTAPRAACPPLEREARVRTVAAMVVRGVTDWREILVAVNRKGGGYEWDVEGSTVKAYLTSARAILAERTAVEIKDLQGQVDAQFEALYRDAETVRDRLAVLAEWNKFRGLNAPTKSELTGRDGGPIRVQSVKDLTDDELLYIASGSGE